MGEGGRTSSSVLPSGSLASYLRWCRGEGRGWRPSMVTWSSAAFNIAMIGGSRVDSHMDGGAGVLTAARWS